MSERLQYICLRFEVDMSSQFGIEGTESKSILHQLSGVSLHEVVLMITVYQYRIASQGIQRMASDPRWVWINYHFASSTYFPMLQHFTLLYTVIEDPFRERLNQDEVKKIFQCSVVDDKPAVILPNMECPRSF